jgi:hypothetical protein
MTTVEKYCSSCGEPIKAAAEICPHCGVRQLPVPSGVAAGEVSDKSFATVLLLCFLLGFFGIHRFYVGKVGTGILTILTFGGFFGIWPFIDLIVIATGGFKDSDGRKIKA